MSRDELDAEVRAFRLQLRELVKKSDRLELEVEQVRHKQNEIRSVLIVLLDGLDKIDELQAHSKTGTGG
jgi:uncharacterized coiled-coil DUF342 family protein